jgi:hypothetical protein
MNVYEIYLDLDKFHFVSIENHKDWERIRFHPHGQPFGDSWIPAQCGYCLPDNEDYKPSAINGDFISIGHRIGLLTATVQKVGHLFTPYGELLPLDIDGDVNQIFWFHCTNVLDAIDEKKSKIRRFDDGRIMAIDDYAFHSDRIGSNEIFHIPGGGYRPFFTESIKQKIESLGLTGLDFRLLWSDEPAGIARLKERRLRNMSGPSSAVN